jgi:hypothetical protein
MTGGVAQVVESLLSKCEVHSSNPSITKNEKIDKKIISNLINKWANNLKQILLKSSINGQ